MDAKEINPRRIKCKRGIDATKVWTFWFPVADGTARLSGRDHEFRGPILRREQPVSEDLRGELQGEPEGFQPTETIDDAEFRRDFWSIQGDFICRHHIELEFNSMCRKKKHSLFRWNTLTTATETNLDVLQERDIDDYWNVDANRSLSDSWKGFKKFTLLKEKPPKGYMWSGRRLTKIQATARPENFVAWSLVQNGKSRSEERKARMGKREGWEALISSIRKMVNIMEPSKTHG